VRQPSSERRELSRASELEREHKLLVYSFDIRSSKGTITEVQVSAIAVGGGLAVALLLSLVVTPTVYAMHRRELLTKDGKETALSDMAKKIMNYHKIGLTLLAGLALAVGALFFFSWLAEEVFEGDTIRFDEAVRAAINQHASPALTSLMRFITFFGSTIFILAVGICVVLYFIWIKWRHAALLFTITMAGALVLNGTLKLLFHRARPEPFFGMVAPTSYSFPSGHALYSLCFYGTLAVIMGSRLRSPAIRLTGWVVAVSLILLVGISRIYLGVHYPSDVLAGYMTAFIWVMAVAFGDHRLWR
jgi:undecaprenyl-diphosphatase